jgi:uncharacterized glyoxalase superfamily protein PhnB
MSAASQTDRQLLAVAPYFLVADIHAAVAYYRDVLGFTFDRIWGDPPGFCMPRRDRLTIMLRQAGDVTQVRPNAVKDCDYWDAYVWVHDADALFEEFSAKGVRVAYPPEDRLYYGNREFAIYDLDGYIIAFGGSLEAKRLRLEAAALTPPA